MRSSLQTHVTKLLQVREIGILIPLIIIFTIASVFTDNFATTANLINMGRAMSFTLIGAVGMTFILISGGLDLSVGSTLALGGMVTGYFIAMAGLPFPLAILLGLIATAIVGLFNGLVISKLSIPPLIVSLGMMNIARGVVNVMNRGRPYTGFPDSFNALGTMSLFGLPLSIYIAIVVVILGHIVLKYTVFGRCITAIGGNEETARVSGINVAKYKTINYILMSLLAGVVGILIAARLATSMANAGTGWELTIIASVVIGGTSLFGGSGSILGTVIGVAIMEVLTVAMVMLRINPYWQSVVVGSIIVLAVGVDVYRRKYMSAKG